MRLQYHQSGFALLMLLVVLLGLTAMGASRILSSSVTQKNTQGQIKTQQVLLEAKEALLSYALDYRVRDLGPGAGPDGAIDYYRMGKLPCPDTVGSSTNEGSQDANCGGASVNTVGYFPFKTVGKGKMEDSARECLWYIVSGDYKNNIGSDLLNWDTVGYMNLVDENNNLKHGATEDDYPVAFIISPGANLGRDRTPIGTLPQCRSNHILASYLEGGPNIDYAVELAGNADTLWRILTTSESATLEDVDFNDHVVAIYRSELWGRVEQLGGLTTDNNAGVAATSAIESLTRSLAECLAEYGEEVGNSRKRLPFPAPIDIQPANNDQNEYRVNSRYNDDDTIRFGRFPQVLDESEINASDFVFDDGGGSYCEPKVATPYDERLWANWKDHFFYIVSEDFDSDSSVDANTDKCNPSGCITVDLKPNKVAAMVIFAGSAAPPPAGPGGLGQSRAWWWDSGGAPPAALIDNKADIANYLEGNDYLTGYVGGTKNFNLQPGTNDYAWCVEYNSSFDLIPVKCADL